MMRSASRSITTTVAIQLFRNLLETCFLDKIPTTIVARTLRVACESGVKGWRIGITNCGGSTLPSVIFKLWLTVRLYAQRGVAPGRLHFLP